MVVKTGVDIRRVIPELKACLDRLDAIYRAENETLTLIPPYGGTREDLELYCAGKSIDVADPFKVSDKFWSKFMDCFGWDYRIISEIDRILIKYEPG